MPADAIPETIGLLLAGGLARRMGGGDKSLRLLAGKPILAHIVERARPQVSELVLNANGDPARFAGFGLPVVADSIEGFAGPLAGVLTGMEWGAANRPQIGWIATIATDTPFFPRDLVARLHAAIARDGADLAAARSDRQDHPVFALWPVRLRHDLRRAMEEGIRKVDVWTARYRLAVADFAVEPFDPFFNANSPGDLEKAEALLPLALGRGGGG